MENAYGVWAIIRDKRGQFVAAEMKKFNGSVEALRIETMAAKEGLWLTWVLGIPAIILEGDAKCLIALGMAPTICLTMELS